MAGQTSNTRAITDLYTMLTQATTTEPEFDTYDPSSVKPPTILDQARNDPQLNHMIKTKMADARAKRDKDVAYLRALEMSGGRLGKVPTPEEKAQREAQIQAEYDKAKNQVKAEVKVNLNVYRAGKKDPALNVPEVIKEGHTGGAVDVKNLPGELDPVELIAYAGAPGIVSGVRAAAGGSLKAGLKAMLQSGPKAAASSIAQDVVGNRTGKGAANIAKMAGGGETAQGIASVVGNFAGQALTGKIANDINAHGLKGLLTEQPETFVRTATDTRQSTAEAVEDIMSGRKAYPAGDVVDVDATVRSNASALPPGFDDFDVNAGIDPRKLKEKIPQNIRDQIGDAFREGGAADREVKGYDPIRRLNANLHATTVQEADRLIEDVKGGIDQVARKVAAKDKGVVGKLKSKLDPRRLGARYDREVDEYMRGTRNLFSPELEDANIKPALSKAREYLRELSDNDIDTRGVLRKLAGEQAAFGDVEPEDIFKTAARYLRGEDVKGVTEEGRVVLSELKEAFDRRTLTGKRFVMDALTNPDNARDGALDLFTMHQYYLPNTYDISSWGTQGKRLYSLENLETTLDHLEKKFPGELTREQWMNYVQEQLSGSKANRHVNMGNMPLVKRKDIDEYFERLYGKHTGSTATPFYDYQKAVRDTSRRVRTRELIDELHANGWVKYKGELKDAIPVDSKTGETWSKIGTTHDPGVDQASASLSGASDEVGPFAARVKWNRGDDAGELRTMTDSTGRIWNVPEDMWVHPTIAKDLTMAPQNLDALRTTGKRLNQVFRKTAVSGNPGTHFMNITSNAVMSYLNGVPPDELTKNLRWAARELSDAGKGSPSRLYRQFRDAGLLTGTYVKEFVSELEPSSFKATLRRGGSIPEAAVNQLEVFLDAIPGMKKLTNAYDWEEEMFKLANAKYFYDHGAVSGNGLIGNAIADLRVKGRHAANYLRTNKLDVSDIKGAGKGKGDVEAAVKMANSALFDYAAQTPLTRGVNAISPMSTWNMKAIPFMGRLMKEHPGRVLAPLTLWMAADNIAEEVFDTELKAERILPMGGLVDLGKKAATGGTLDKRDFLGLAEDLVRPGGMLPATVEAMANKSLFTGREIYPEEYGAGAKLVEGSKHVGRMLVPGAVRNTGVGLYDLLTGTPQNRRGDTLTPGGYVSKKVLGLPTVDDSPEKWGRAYLAIDAALKRTMSAATKAQSKSELNKYIERMKELVRDREYAGKRAGRSVKRGQK
jgi:hypothetical protein